MDDKIELRLDGPHLPTAVEEELPAVVREIEAAVDEFFTAADHLIGEATQEHAERAWTASRLAWNLLLPRRHAVLRTHRAMVERFLETVQRLREFIANDIRSEDEIIERLARDLLRRESLLAALLSENREPRIRALLTANEAN